jgi:hypothetical protein
MAASLVPFLHALYEHGRLVVTSDPEGLAADPGELREAIGEFDASARLNIAGRAPELSFEAAAWAARILYQCAQFLVCRDAGEDRVRAALQKRCPLPHGPSVDYSVDLLFVYLPQMIALARRLAEGDPLLAELRRLASEWPLSNVGVDEITVGAIDSFIGDASLRQLYADRILERGDARRLADPRVAETLRVALGAHTHLAGEIAAAFAHPSPDHSPEGVAAASISPGDLHESTPPPNAPVL